MKRLYTSLFIFGLLVIIGALGLFRMAKANEMNLRNKIGQMFIIGFEGNNLTNDSPIVKVIEEDNIGGVILSDFTDQTEIPDKNIESPEQVKQLTQSLQQFNKMANLKYNRLALPLFIAVDYEGGKVNRLKAEYGFPETMSAAELGRLGLIQANREVQKMAMTLQSSGFNLDFAPVLDVNVNPDNPIIGKKDRSFSNKPSYVSSFAALFSNNLLPKGVQCVYKHFPGHGSSTADSHLGFVDVSHTWNAYELEMYEQLLNINDGCGLVMSAHIINRQLDESGLPATLSHKILTELLREKLKFEGVIISDDMEMKAISDQFGVEEAIGLAINAGVDMFIFENLLAEKRQQPKHLIDIIVAKVNSGEISEKRVNEAYRRIVTLKRSIH